MIRPLSRRTFLRGTGVGLALPWLDAMTPSVFASPRLPARPRRRMVCMCYGLSLEPDYFVPKQPGRNYTPSPYLEVLKEFRNDFTVFSGLFNPGMESAGGHGADVAFLTGARGVGLPGFKNTVSIDQFVVAKIGPETRFPSLSLGRGSVSRNGVALPADASPSKLFARLFLEGTPQEVEREAQRLRQGHSILDVVRGQARQIEGKVAHGDRQKLDEYLDAVRDVEQRLASAQSWAKKPKPKVDAAPPQENPGNAGITLRLQYDLIHLAFQTDSTRLVTQDFVHWGVPPLPGVTYDHHNLSHHGKDPEKLKQLETVEKDAMAALRDFLAKLKNTKEEGETLLDRTMVLAGSHMHSGAHAVTNLPILLAGGGFKHGQCLAFDPANNKPLCNLYVMMIRQFGLEVDAFGSSEGTIPGLEVAKA